MPETPRARKQPPHPGGVSSKESSAHRPPPSLSRLLAWSHDFVIFLDNVCGWNIISDGFGSDRTLLYFQSRAPDAYYVNLAGHHAQLDQLRRLPMSKVALRLLMALA